MEIKHREPARTLRELYNNLNPLEFLTKENRHFYVDVYGDIIAEIRKDLLWSDEPLHIKLASLLSKKDMLKHRLFADSLERLETGEPYLGVLGADTRRLAGALERELFSIRPETFFETRLDEDAGNLHRLVLDWTQKEKPVLLNLATYPAKNNTALAGQLLLHRDELFRRQLALVVVVSEPLFHALHTKAFDFVSVASFTHRFKDQAKTVEDDFHPLEQKPGGVVAYEDALKEWKAEKEKTKPDSRRLMMRAFRTGETAYKVSKLEEALKFYLEAIQLARQLNDDHFLSGALRNIGIVYRDMGLFNEASAALEEAQKIGDLKGEGAVLGNIGLIKKDKGKLNDALIYLNRALKLHQKLQYKKGEAMHLGNIGLVYKAKGEYKKALMYHKKALGAIRNSGYLYGEAIQLNNLGMIYVDKENPNEALKCVKQAERIFEQLGASQELATVRSTIAEIRTKQLPA